jgi:APA family basic amino acid/polyamine antiporter
VGIILGAGVYVLVGAAAGRAGNAVWLSFIIAAVAAGLTGLSYARLSRSSPKNAPEYHYVAQAFNRSLAFFAGWLILWAGCISAAAVSLGFAGYLQHLVGVPPLFGALVIILFSALLAFLGIGESSILAGVLTLVEAAGLVLIIIIGLPYLGRVNLFEAPGGLAGILSTASLVFFAYLGFESMANLAEEMKKPEKDLPRAIFLAIAISTVFYVMVSLSAVSVLGWQALSESAAPLAAVAAKVLGGSADLILTLIAISSTANTVLLLLVATSRAMWAMACNGGLPKIFCVLGERRRTPWLTVIVTGLFTGIFATLKNIDEVAELTNFVTLLAFVGVNASALKLFARNSTAGRFRKMFLDVLMPVLGIIVSLFLMINTGLRAAVYGGLLLLAGMVIYVLMAVTRRPKKGVNRGEG